MNVPETKYATAADGTSIAYSTYGTGPLDILVSHPWLSHLEVYWEWPGYGRFIRGLAEGARVILFDKRGVGMSGPTLRDPDLETRVGDILAVLDAAVAPRPVVFAYGEGAASACMLAATFPGRVDALVLYAPVVWYPKGSDSPDGIDHGAEWEAQDRLLFANWGSEAGVETFLRSSAALTDPALIADPTMRRWGARFQRYACSPDALRAFERVFSETDARHMLPAVRVATLVLEGSYESPDPWARDVAARIPTSRLEVIERRQWAPWVDDSEAFGQHLRRFLGALHDDEAGLDRVLATVLFTDIVNSTSTAAGMGDARWRKLIEEHDRVARTTVSRFRGANVESRGDGVMATFDGPARAVRCARAIAEGLQPLGLEIRAGAHTGEIEVAGGRAQGVAVHIAARVAARAEAGEIWASATVKDLTAGSGLVFEDLGEHELKGVPERWRLYRVATS
jgi:class 3 adenylate cyclase